LGAKIANSKLGSREGDWGRGGAYGVSLVRRGGKGHLEFQDSP